MGDDIARAREQAAQLKNEISKVREQFVDANLDDVASSHPAAPTLAPKCRRDLKGHFGKVYAMHWSEDSRHLVSAAQDSTLIVWNAFTGKKANWVMLLSGWPMACAYSPSGNFVASGGLDNNCTIHNIRSKETPIRVPSTELEGHQGYLSGCRFLSDEKILTCSGDMSCILWDIPRRTRTMEFLDHTADVMSIALSPKDKNLFVSGSVDTKTKLWDMRTGKAVKTFGGHTSDVNSVQFFPNGNLIGTGSDDSTCRLFDIRAYRELREFKYQASNANSIEGGHVTSIAFSASGRYLFSGFDDYGTFACNVWDTVHGKRLADLDVQSRVACMGMAPDGYALCTGMWDNVLKIWA